jgi:hypothetical protein
MASSTRFSVNLVGLAGTTAILFATHAMAQEQLSSEPLPSSKQWIAVDRCAAYGPDFISVEGTQNCVRIGGHVRVDAGVRNTGQGAGAAPAAMQSETIEGGDSDLGGAEHLRLRQDAAPTYDGSYLR